MLMLKMRLALLPLIASFSAPGPRITSGPEIWIAPAVRKMFPVCPRRSMMSEPGLLFASAIASRRLPA